jgi:hypothetical protein
MRSHQVILRQIAQHGLDPTKAHVVADGKLVPRETDASHLPEEVPLKAAFTAPAEDVNPHVGSTLDSMFEELGEKEEVVALTEQKIAALDAEEDVVEKTAEPPPSPEVEPETLAVEKADEAPAATPAPSAAPKKKPAKGKK